MIGFHTSVTSKKLKKSIQKAFEYCNGNAKVFQIYLKSPQRYALSKIPSEQIELTKEYIKDNNITLVSHACYLLNCCNETKWEQKIMNAVDDLLVIDSIGGIGSVFHVGKYLKTDLNCALDKMREFISTVIEQTDKLGCKSHFILETAAGQGTECLTDIEDFGEFYKSLDDNIRKRVSICIDTCHVFAAGYDLRTENKSKQFITLVNESIGWENVKLIHLNDSDKPLSSRVDRHANLLKGYISKDDENGLKYFVKHSFNLKIPIVLETPAKENSRFDEIELLLDWIK